MFATLRECRYRMPLDDEAFRCGHPSVRSRSALVDRSVCSTCELADRDSPHFPRKTGAGTNCLLAAPAESLRRDPSGWDKLAYVRLLARAFRAEVVLIDEEDELPAIVERQRPQLLLTMNLPWYDRFSDRPFWKLPRQLPIVTVHDDCRRRMHPNLEAVLDRSAAVISPARYPVLREFPSLANRLAWLPYFIPSDIPRYQMNESPNLKCLLTGATSRSYPLRRRALETIPESRLTRLCHPGYWRLSYSAAVMGKRYLDLMHDHFMALTCGSIYHCVVAKYFEIPYVRALLIAEDQPDLPSLGFRAGEHFVAVDDGTDLAALVEEIAASPERYREIRKRGQRLVVDRHTEAAREPEAQGMVEGILQLVGLSSGSPKTVIRQEAVPQ